MRGVLRAHVCNYILLIHELIQKTLLMVCPVESARSAIAARVLPRLRATYRQVLTEARRIADHELGSDLAPRLLRSRPAAGRLMTCPCCRGVVNPPETRLWRTLSHEEQETCIRIYRTVRHHTLTTADIILSCNVYPRVFGPYLQEGPQAALNHINQHMVNNMSEEDINTFGAEGQSSDYARETIDQELGVLRRAKLLLRFVDIPDPIESTADSLLICA